jgi:hypothetical protein
MSVQLGESGSSCARRHPSQNRDVGHPAPGEMWGIFGLAHRRSFDCSSRDRTARAFAQDDTSSITQAVADWRWWVGVGMSMHLERAVRAALEGPISESRCGAPGAWRNVGIFGLAHRRSFDCGSRDKAARAFAQDDTSSITQAVADWRWWVGVGMSVHPERAVRAALEGTHLKIEMWGTRL